MTPEDFANSGTWASCCHSLPTYVSLADAPTEFANPATHAPTLWNPTALDYNDFIRYAKRLDCYGVLLTAKHVDGFCTWPSAVKVGGQRRTVLESTWYAANGNRNPLKEFCDIARKHDLKVGHYFCVWDEFIELQLGGSPGAVTPAVYTQWTLDQLSEILDPRVYGSIDCIILDGWGTTWSGSGVTFTDVVYDTVYDHIKAIQPGCVVLVNDHETGTESTRHGDVSLWERNVDAEPLAADAAANLFAGGQCLWDPLFPPNTGGLAAANIWFDHVDGTTITAAHVASPTSRRYRSYVNGTVYMMNYAPYLDGLLAADLKTLLNVFVEPTNTFAGGDDFSLNGGESVGLNLQSHVSVMSGIAWTKTYGTANAVIDPSGAARVNHVNGVAYTNNTTLSSANYRHEVDFKFLTVPNPFIMTVMARVLDSTHDYRFQSEWNGTTWLFKLQYNSAGLTQIVSFDGAGITNTPNGTFPNTVPTVGYLYRLVIQPTGTTNPVTLLIEVWIDITGTGNSFRCWARQILTTTVVVASGPPGIYWTGLGSATTGLQIVKSMAYVVDVTSPSVPTGLAVGGVSSGLEIAWSGAPSDLWLFEVFRSTDNVTYVQCGQTTENSFIDGTAVAGTTYYYKVRSVDTSFNSSALSSSASGALDDANKSQIGGLGPFGGGMLASPPL